MEYQLSSLQELRDKVLALNSHPEIIGPNAEDYDYPEAEIEKAYCKLLWEIDEAIRDLVKNKPQ